MLKMRYKLTVLSPIHIGGLESEVNNMEFFYDSRYLYNVSEVQMAKALSDEGLMEEFINFMSSGRDSLQGYFQALPLANKEALKKRLQVKKILLTEVPIKRINSFRPFKEDPLTREPYIPGSSIKGALRGDILFLLIDKKLLKSEEIARAVQRSRGSDRRRIGNMVNRLLESADLEHTRQRQHKDWLRALKVSDAFCQDKESSSIREVKVTSLNRNGNGYHWGAREASIYVEALKPETVFTFTVEIDRWLLKVMESRRPAQFDLQDIFNNKIKFQYLDAAEQAFWNRANVSFMIAKQKSHISDGANLRLGWGSGYLGTTVGAYLNEHLRRDIGRKFYNTRYDIFPNSRKTVVVNESPVDTLGWCKVERL